MGKWLRMTLEPQGQENPTASAKSPEPFFEILVGEHKRRMKKKYSDGSLCRYIKYFVFRNAFLHKQVFMGRFVPSPRMNFLRPNQTNKYRSLMSNHEFILFWFYPEVSKSEDIQATQQLKFTNKPRDKRKAESQPEVFAGKSKRGRKYQTSWERDFPWLVHNEEKNTIKSKICCSFPEIADKSSSLFIGNGAFRCTTI